MAKIGRNEKCPCLSGKKYKQCCGKSGRASVATSPEQQMKITLMNGVRQIQEDALRRRTLCRELGVFFFFSTAEGDGWLIEMTECDCVQVAKAGELLKPPIDENSETIEINWSHSYRIVDRKLELTSYTERNNNVLFLKNAPTRELNAAMRRIRKRFTEEQLSQVHLTEEAAQNQ